MAFRISVKPWGLFGVAAGLWLCSAHFPSSARAELPGDRPGRLPALGLPLAASADTRALVLNPANLGFLPGPEFRWSAFYLSENATLSHQGHALSLGTPLPLIPVSAGLRFEWVAPARAALLPNYQWLTWGLAFKPADTLSIGFTSQHAFSSSALVDGLGSWSLGITSRPVNQLAIAAAVHDLNAPASQAGTAFARSYDFGLALRPLGTRAVELGLEGRYIDGANGYWVPRATLGIEIPELGRLHGDFAMQDPGADQNRRAWLASAHLAFYFNGQSGSAELSAGALFGNALGSGTAARIHENLHTEVALRGFREPNGIEGVGRALRIRIEDTPGVREHVALLRRLWSIAEREPAVNAVVFELRSAPAGSLAHIEELRDAVLLLRQTGKRVLCHLEDADGSSLYLCSAANRTLLNPGGGLRFAGLRTRYLYYKPLLDKLGINADFVRIGSHKSAPEMFMRESASDVARADKIDLLQQFEKYFALGVSAGRGMSVNDFRERLARGPFIASEAKAAGFVDGYAFDDQLELEVSKLAGMPLRLTDDRRAERAPEDFGNTRRIALVYLDGDMVDGRSRTLPLIGVRLAGSYTIAESIKRARENPNIGALVLRVETGGGSAMAAEVLWREVRLTAAVKPVIVSMGSSAASGGYYVASAGTRIFANPLSVTGSIGIFYGKADITGLMQKIGVNVEVYKTHARADAESLFRPYTADEKQELSRKVGQFYDQFLARVAEGRKLSKAEVDSVGQGRVWTGAQAHQHRLVDELGGLRQALALARKLGELPERSEIIELPPPDTSLLGRLLGIEGLKAEAAAASGELLPEALTSAARALAPFVIQSGDKPLAISEIVAVEP